MALQITNEWGIFFFLNCCGITFFNHLILETPGNSSRAPKFNEFTPILMSKGLKQPLAAWPAGVSWEQSQQYKLCQSYGEDLVLFKWCRSSKSITSALPNFSKNKQNSISWTTQACNPIRPLCALPVSKSWACCCLLATLSCFCVDKLVVTKVLHNFYM